MLHVVCIMLCYGMLYYVMLQYITIENIRFVMLCHVRLHFLCISLRSISSGYSKHIGLLKASFDGTATFYLIELIRMAFYTMPLSRTVSKLNCHSVDCQPKTFFPV
jgi:hypothetical protein